MTNMEVSFGFVALEAFTHVQLLYITQSCMDKFVISKPHLHVHVCHSENERKFVDEN